jgi:branched-subunit amino acid aminotransferase/4-amino-4-deoxychorismate lyase
VKKIIYKGNYLDAGATIVTAENRGLRYGDGCFETMKVINGKIALKELHFERLFSSIDILGFDLPKNFNAAEIEEQVISLSKKNGHATYGRVRLNVFRGNGGLYDPENHFPNYIIETWDIEKSIGDINENGLVIDIYRDARKAADNFSHIKSNSFLPYVMAANWAKKNQLNDALLLNSFSRLADSTIANIFLVSDGVIKTPAISEGCIAGVMRKYLVKCCRNEGIPVEETGITPGELQNASEVFLTNAIRGIRWVKQIGDSGYRSQIAQVLYQNFIKTIWV